MKGLMIFDNLNDIIYMKHDESFSKHIRKLAVVHGLINEKDIGNKESDYNASTVIIMQLFSPLITSQRVMLNHFSNPYSSIKCYDGLHIVFEEYIGYLFVSIGCEDEYFLKRYLGVFISILKHTCGPDLSTLKVNESYRQLISNLLDIWSHRILTEQSQLIEAMEQLRVTSQIAFSSLKVLTDVAEKIKSSLSISQVHAFITINHRFLSLYSTRNANELLFSDMQFLTLIGDAVENRFIKPLPSIFANTDDETVSKPNSELEILKPKVIKSADVTKDFVFLLSKQKPHAVHIHHIVPTMPLFLIYEIGNDHLNTALLDTLRSFHTLQDIHTRGTTDREVIHSSVEVADNAVKKLSEILKKKSVSSIIDKTAQNTFKTAYKKWDAIKKKYQDYLKTHNLEWLQKIDSTVDNIISLFRNIYSSCIMDNTLARSNRKIVLPILENAQKTLQSVVDILEKSNYFSPTGQTKSSLSINKYLEEFHGLVHFIYIDRVTHRFIAPNLDFSSVDTVNLTRKKIWNMVKFAWSHLQEGRTTLVWKDTIFNYSYFLWFEDVSGTPLKPKISPLAVMKTLSSPGVLNGDFYLSLIKKCFPAMSTQRIRCYELFSIHLSLVTSSCVLEQSRRLTATIWEVTGIPANPLELL